MKPTKLYSICPSVFPSCFCGCPVVHLFIFFGAKTHSTSMATRCYEIYPSHRYSYYSNNANVYFFTPIPNIPTPCEKNLHTLFVVIYWVKAFYWRSSSASWLHVLTIMEMIKLSEHIHHTLYDNVVMLHLILILYCYYYYTELI